MSSGRNFVFWSYSIIDHFLHPTRPEHSDRPKPNKNTNNFTYMLSVTSARHSGQFRTTKVTNRHQKTRPHICHRYHRLYLWRKICHVEKFQISVKNLNNLWSFIEIYAVFVLNLCGEKSVWRKSLWRKNDKYEVCC